MNRKNVLAVGVSLTMMSLMFGLHYGAYGSCLLQPDYQVHDLWCSDTSASVGTLVQVGDVITNTCKSTAVPTTTRIYISTNASQLMCIWDFHSTPGLAKNGSATWSNTLEIPACAVPGVTNFIICVADATGLISENLENNNRDSIAIFISP